MNLTQTEYEITDEGIVEIQVGKRRNRARVFITRTKCELVGLARSLDQRQWHAMIQWKDRDGRDHADLFPMNELHSSQSKICATLAEQGLAIVPGRERNLLAYFGTADTQQRYCLSRQTGWLEDNAVFVLPYMTVGATLSGEAVIYQACDEVMARLGLCQSGSPEEWRAQIAGVCAGHPVLAFWCAAAFLPPLLGHLSLECGGFHLYGMSSEGKTAAEQVAASVWGNGADPSMAKGSSYVRRWNLTKNAAEGLAESHTDIPLCLDEIGEADSRDFGRLIYQLAGGQGRGRMTSSTSMQRTRSWRTLVLSTGEVQIGDMVERHGESVKAGQLVRIVDIPAIDEVTGDGIIISANGADKTQSFVESLKKSCSIHYGHAGAQFVWGLIQEGLDIVTNDLRTAVDESAASLVSAEAPDASKEVRRVARRFAAVAVVGEKAIALGCLPWAEGEATKAVRIMFRRYRRARGGSGSDTMRGVQAVANFILKHRASRFGQLNSENEKVINLAGYRTNDNEHYYFTKEGFQEACAGQHPSTVARCLKKIGWLNCPDEGHLTERVTVADIKGRIRLYAVKAAILQGVENDASLDRSSEEAKCAV